MTIIRYSGWYSPATCQIFPSHIFVFGDNLRRFGKGGQAIIRDEPNAFGIATKRLPATTEDSFFWEGSALDLNAVLNDIGDLWSILRDGLDVIIPVTKNDEVSLGLERAKLRETAPSIYATIAKHISEMGDSYGVEYAADPAGIDLHYTKR